jgi:hypothetical protein
MPSRYELPIENFELDIKWIKNKETFDRNKGQSRISANQLFQMCGVVVVVVK